MISEEMKKVLELYNEGKKHYKLKEFENAKECFQKALKLDPNDGPSIFFLERCVEYIKDPPPDDWDGVYVMKTK